MAPPPGAFHPLGSNESSDDDVTPGESRSVANGMERVPLPTPAHRSLNGSSSKQVLSRSQRDQGILQTKNTILDEFTNKLLPPEETDYMVKRLEKRAEEQYRRTYVSGVPLADVLEAALVLRVGLTFLPGADKPQVNRLEQTNMAGREPNQKDAGWRINTAGSLLVQFDVAQDLSIVQTDQTSAVVLRAKTRMHERDRYFQDQRKAKALRSRPHDTVTIDSEHVKLVEDLGSGEWDIEGLLIEVDGGSLWDLMLDFRHLISQGGPGMTNAETSMVLEKMIEDARRLCIRSPILFRMSTRSRIISSKNTLYGVDHGPMFRTLTTSKGIREIISLSASYYNSLDPTGNKDTTQSLIRPRFLQMIVLLLSLLNNNDLSEIKDFLESTYGLKADRRSLELCVLKVVPLLSINPKVFLKSLIPAIEGFPLNSDATENQSHCWNVVVKRILEYGYLLPGTVADLGRPSLSWIVKWPKEGFKSTAVFNHLQYSGPLRTMNDIPPIELNPNGSLNELTVVMTDDSKYVISCDDLELITCLTPGAYPVQEATPSKRNFDLLIHETQINGELYEAIRMTNSIVRKVNTWLANPMRSGIKNRLIKRSTVELAFLNEMQGSGRLTKNVATLLQRTLAVAYKVEGRKISRTDAVRNMARDIRYLSGIINLIEVRWGAVDHKFFSEEKRELRQALDGIRAQVSLAEQRRANLARDIELSGEPIAKCLYPEGANTSDTSFWNEYTAWSHENTGVLNIEAKHARVSGVRWLNDDVIELSLYNQPLKIFVTPLEPVPEGLRNDEVQVDDIVLLLGQYLAVGVLDEGSGNPEAPLSMTNYLRITSMEEQSRTRRGMNRIENLDSRVLRCFK